mmetsp:Transcript_8544/g.14016  ORF Transcript_8544/g.14016 Transcript_8544/m.14016 type:complete len:325 (-) Transcript_8544:1443-2417(-)
MIFTLATPGRLTFNLLVVLEVRRFLIGLVQCQTRVLVPHNLPRGPVPAHVVAEVRQALALVIVRLPVHVTDVVDVRVVRVIGVHVRPVDGDVGLQGVVLQALVVQLLLVVGRGPVAGRRLRPVVALVPRGAGLAVDVDPQPVVLVVREVVRQVVDVQGDGGHLQRLQLERAQVVLPRARELREVRPVGHEGRVAVPVGHRVHPHQHLVPRGRAVVQVVGAHRGLRAVRAPGQPLALAHVQPPGRVQAPRGVVIQPHQLLQPLAELLHVPDGGPQVEDEGVHGVPGAGREVHELRVVLVHHRRLQRVVGLELLLLEPCVLHVEPL